LRHESGQPTSRAAQCRPLGAAQVGSLSVPCAARDRDRTYVRARRNRLRPGGGTARQHEDCAPRGARRPFTRCSHRRARRRRASSEAGRSTRIAARVRRARKPRRRSAARRGALGRTPGHRRADRVLRSAHGAPLPGTVLVIVTVTLNAAIDRTLTVPNFQPGQRHRASAGLTLAGGKGINVARALKRLDVPVVATGLAGGRTGTRIVEELTSEAILNDFVRIADESRTSTAVVDPTAGTYTEINEWGPRVEPEELTMLLDKISYLSRAADIVVFAGTLPRGVDDSFYAEGIRDLNRRHVRAALDSEGQPLRLG